MKTAFKYLFGILGIFLFSSCSEPDEINMGSKNLNASNLIQIETAQSYKVNELLYINATFSRYLPESGYDSLLDIYKTTKSEKYIFRFSLEKKSAYNTWSAINIGENLIVEKGDSQMNYENSGICILNPLTNIYEFRGGISLLESGTFRIRISNDLLPIYNSNSFITVNIFTTIAMTDDQGYYNFTVD